MQTRRLQYGVLVVSGVSLLLTVCLVSDVYQAGPRPIDVTGSPGAQSRLVYTIGAATEEEKHVPKYCNKSLSPDMDILSKPPLRFSRHFKNPCWFTRSTLRCLPYFIIAGVAKSGTTDLFSRIALHPQVIRPAYKEPNWFSNLRFLQSASLVDYTEFYRSLVERLARNRYTHKYFITGEGSISNADGPGFWHLLPGNIGKEEPVYTNAHIIHHLNPNTKILFIVRNPVERLWSEYLAFSSAETRSPEIFHTLVTRALAAYDHCLQTTSFRGCMYNRTLFLLSTMSDTEIQKHPDGCQIKPHNIISIRRGVYHVFIRDFMQVFPKDQLLVLRLEDMSSQPVANMNKVYDFLELDPVNPLTENAIVRASIRNRRRPMNRYVEEMWPKTRALLYSYYRSHNAELAVLLNDTEFAYGPV